VAEKFKLAGACAKMFKRAALAAVSNLVVFCTKLQPAPWGTREFTLLEIRVSGRLASLNFISPHSSRRVAEKFKQGLSGKPDRRRKNPPTTLVGGVSRKTA